MRNTAVLGCRKSLFLKLTSDLLSLSPLGHSDGFASCKARCVLISASLPKTHFHVKGCVCLVGSASCRAFGHTRPASVPGLSVGLPPLDQARMLAVSRTKPLHDAVAQMADDLYGGYAPKQGCFGCLPKVLHDAKPAEQATLDTPFLKII